MSARFSGGRRPRLAIVASHPIQHFCPLYRGVAADGRVELKVFFASDAGKSTYYDPGFARYLNWGENITDGFEHEYLSSSASYDLVTRPGSQPMAHRLANFAPDLVQVYGYNDKLARQALVWAKRTHRQSLMVGDSELLSPRTKAALAVKALLLPLVFRMPTGFITIGDENERYYKHYGVSPKRLRRSPIPIDSGLLEHALADKGQLRATTRTAWKAADTDVVILVVGKSIARKAHDHVLRAAAMMPSSLRERTITVFAGGGPESERLSALAVTLGVRSHHVGLLSIPDLMAAYVSADVLVHPSAADPHPLAIAEGVYAGLPIVLSDRVGSWGPTDDVRPGANGLRYAFGDLSQLSERLTDLTRDGELRKSLASESRRIGLSRGLTASVQTYVDAVLETSGVSES